VGAVTPLDSFLFLAATIGALWCLWLILSLVFELLEFWHDSLREDRYRKSQRFADFYVANYDQPSAEDGGEQTTRAEASG
jgi:hypothetical protein